MWVFGWTVVFSPFWVLLSHGPVCGLEHQMSQRGMPNYNEFLFGAGQVLSMMGLPLGLLVSELFSRRNYVSWVVGLSGIAVAFLSLIGGAMVAIGAFHPAAQ